MSEMTFKQAVEGGWLYTAREKFYGYLTTDELIKIVDRCKVDGRWYGAFEAAKSLEEPRRSIELKKIMDVFDEKEQLLDLCMVIESLPSPKLLIELKRVNTKYGRLSFVEESSLLP